VSVVANQIQRGDADATLASSEVGTTAFFGDAYMSRNGAGVNYFETLSLYNPASEAIDVRVTLLFTNGLSSGIDLTVGANGFDALQLHEFAAFVNDPNRTQAFSMVVTSDSPFAANFSHYDLSFGGGWATSGARFGIYNPISGILT
jgi:hypothetical protein